MTRMDQVFFVKERNQSMVDPLGKVMTTTIFYIFGIARETQEGKTKVLPDFSDCIHIKKYKSIKHTLHKKL